MSVAEYMTLCLLDPTDGYYPTRDPLGSDGDFITAPEISQMFGELLGLFVLQSWRDMGSPSPVALAELGPGTGKMMADILRTARLDPGFLNAATVHLVEASPALQAVQGGELSHTPVPVLWHDSLEALPRMPLILIGNEYLDCLPIRQLVRRSDGWRERVVTIQGDALAFAQSSTPHPEEARSTVSKYPDEGDLLELRPATAQVVASLADRLHAHPGRALFIDYGPADTEFGDTLQALKRHEKVDPLDTPGDADLTARVDFGQLAREAEAAGLAVSGPVTQAALLSRLGLEVRASALLRANPAAKPALARQLHRLTDAEEMGTLFKAICLSSPGLPAPLGFG